MYQNIVVEDRGAVRLIYINRTEVLNALNAAVIMELKSAIHDFERSPSVQAVIITGSGEKAFAAGADIEAQCSLNAEDGYQWGKAGHELCNMLEDCAKPIIAAVNGYALGGGCELAMACDIRLASDKAWFGQPEVTLGITPGYGGTQRLPRLVGAGKAKQMIFTGQHISASEAYRIGLVDEVYPAAELLSEAIKMAEQIIANAPLAVRCAKTQINHGLQTDIHTACELELGLFSLCFASSDQKEGMSAFLAKRKAVFTGK